MKKLSAVLFTVLAAVFILPVAATVLFSFISYGSPSLRGYSDLLFDCFIFYPMFWNSVLYAAAITLVQLAVIIPCAFGFSQAKFRGKGALFVFYIILMMMPLQVTILPNYIGLRDMGLVDTPWGIILPMIFSPFGVVVMHQYMKNIDHSVIEATRLETSSILRILFTSVIPQLRVCILAVILFVFADCWNMFEQPMLFLKDDRLKTLSVFITNAQSYEGEVLFPAAVIFLIPVLILYLFFNQNLEKGLTLGDLS
ncbi:MAG: carbohydrate ABC transporter permease [Bacteroides sp.]|nr:carbohydrate ABC transporter permease [Eubacterium sp.]MCM1418723.1 carbohydrate ABC transporter permease [Roseburia sp.]MCM1462790.1 carbohydrate ABC transporter permease [Bacteroides sp.]